LEIKCYADIVERLKSSGLRIDLRNELQDRLLSMRFWFCAVSVNQHSNICGGFGPEPKDQNSKEYRDWDKKRRDTITKNIYPICSCRAPKYFNAAGSKCEINKFDDMLNYMSHQCDHFRLVVAVDPQAELFSRIWCMAELVEAARLQIDIIVKLPSEDFVQQHTKKLKEIRIEDCQATFQRDVDHVLEKLNRAEGDATKQFNAELQKVLFGGQHRIGILAESHRIGILAESHAEPNAKAKAAHEEFRKAGGEVTEGGKTLKGSSKIPAQARSVSMVVGAWERLNR